MCAKNNCNARVSSMSLRHEFRAPKRNRTGPRAFFPPNALSRSARTHRKHSQKCIIMIMRLHITMNWNVDSIWFEYVAALDSNLGHHIYILILYRRCSGVSVGRTKERETPTQYLFVSIFAHSILSVQFVFITFCVRLVSSQFCLANVVCFSGTASASMFALSLKCSVWSDNFIAQMSRYH